MRRLIVFGSGAAIIGILLLIVAFFEAYIIVSQLQKALSTTGPNDTITLLEEATIQAVFLGIMAGVGYALVSKGLDGIRKQEALEMERPILGSVVLAQPALSGVQGLQLMTETSPPKPGTKTVKPVAKSAMRVRPSPPATPWRPAKSEAPARPSAALPLEKEENMKKQTARQAGPDTESTKKWTHPFLREAPVDPVPSLDPVQEHATLPPEAMIETEPLHHELAQADSHPVTEAEDPGPMISEGEPQRSSEGDTRQMDIPFPPLTEAHTQVAADTSGSKISSESIETRSPDLAREKTWDQESSMSALNEAAPSRPEYSELTPMSQANNLALDDQTLEPARVGTVPANSDAEDEKSGRGRSRRRGKQKE